MPNAGHQPRDGNGHYTRDPDTANRDAEICRMRRDGMSLRAIGQQLDMHHKSVAEALQRALRAIVEEPAQDVRALAVAQLDAELQRLNDYETAARAVLQHEHVTVSHGRIITSDDGAPIPDTAPVLAAIDRLVRIEDARRRNAERRAKLLGLDATQPIHVELERRLDLEAATVADAITAALEALNLPDDQHTAALQAAQARLLESAPESDA